jgi:hypothetical protein
MRTAPVWPVEAEAADVEIGVDLFDFLRPNPMASQLRLVFIVVDQDFDVNGFHGARLPLLTGMV